MLDKVFETKNLTHLIDETAHIRDEGMPCIALIITDKLHLLVESGVCLSLGSHRQHHII